MRAEMPERLQSNWRDVAGAEKIEGVAPALPWGQDRVEARVPLNVTDL